MSYSVIKTYIWNKTSGFVNEICFYENEKFVLDPNIHHLQFIHLSKYRHSIDKYRTI